MAKIIEFYVPSGFRKKITKWVPPEQEGKVIAFDAPQKAVSLGQILIVFPSRTG
jgi:hypothetical protein